MSRAQVGQVFAGWRKKSGLTFDAAADVLDCGRSTIDAIERGRCYPSFKTLCRFMDASGVDFSVLAEAGEA